MASRCRIQSSIFWSNSRKRTQRNDRSFPSSLTMKWYRICAPKGEFNRLSCCVIDSWFRLLDLQADALPESLLILAEPIILRSPGYTFKEHLLSALFYYLSANVNDGVTLDTLCQNKHLAKPIVSICHQKRVTSPKQNTLTKRDPESSFLDWFWTHCPRSIRA